MSAVASSSLLYPQSSYQTALATRASRWQFLADIALGLNLILLLFAGLLPYGLPAFFLRYGAAGSSFVLAYIVAFKIDVRIMRKALGVFVPFALIGLISGIFGYDPGASIGALIRWALNIFLAIALGVAFDYDRTIRIIFYTLFASMVASIVVAIALPGMGTELYGTDIVWRGVFVQKNHLGWTALLGIILTITAVREHWMVKGAMMLCATIALIGSGAKGSLALVVIASGYWMFLVTVMRLRLPMITTLLIQIAAVVVAVLSFYTIAQIVLPMLGRDLTFTGRTLAWAAYGDEAMRHWVLGQGPGALTSDSDITQRLLDTNDFEEQNIRTPHNSFIGVLGDAGIGGLAAYLYMMIYMAFVAPAARPVLPICVCAVFAFLRLIAGFTETLEIYSEGMGALLIALTYSYSVRSVVR